MRLLGSGRVPLHRDTGCLVRKADPHITARSKGRPDKRSRPRWRRTLHKNSQRLADVPGRARGKAGRPTGWAVGFGRAYHVTVIPGLFSVRAPQRMFPYGKPCQVAQLVQAENAEKHSLSAKTENQEKKGDSSLKTTPPPVHKSCKLGETHSTCHRRS
jgi:hypothetical protein